MADQKVPESGAPPPYTDVYPVHSQGTSELRQGTPTVQYMPDAGGYSNPGGHLPQHGPPVQSGLMGAVAPATTSHVHVLQPVAGPVTAFQPIQPPRDYTLPSILTCLFCCPPIGIFAIAAALESSYEAGKGNIVAAHNSARTARSLTIASTVCGIVIGIFSIIYFTTRM